MAEVQVLSTADCIRLLRSGVVGRVAVSTPQGPHVVPVNHAVIGRSIVLRTAASSVLVTVGVGSVIGFEIDHVDYTRHLGWSVLARGPASILSADEVTAAEHEWAPRPWAGGERSAYVGLCWTQLTGRRLGGGWDIFKELPVNRSAGVVGR